VLERYLEWVGTVPDELTSVARILHVPPLPFLLELIRGRSFVVVEAALLGTEEEGTKLLEPMRATAGARELIEFDALAHLVTINRDGSPQVTCIWVGLDGDEIVSAHLRSDQRKLRNVRRDPRVALSLEGREIQPPGLKQYLVVHGRARLGRRRPGAPAATRPDVPRPRREVPTDGRSASGPRDAQHRRANRRHRSLDCVGRPASDPA
jgi:PPOX class probable F420-dependent enzyme